MSVEQPGPSVAVIGCSGGWAQRARQQGEQLAPFIQRARDTMHGLEAVQSHRPGWLPRPLFRRLAEGSARRFVRRSLGKDDRNILDALHNLAGGAGLSASSVVMMNLLESRLGLVEVNEARPGLGACTAVAVKGSQHGPHVSRNLDQLNELVDYYVVRRNEPTGGYRYLSMTTAPTLGTVDGVNERGLAITYNYAFAVSRSTAGPPLSINIQEALERCATVREAVQLLLARPRLNGGLLMLVDATGDAASLELADTVGVAVRPTPGETALVHTNFFSAESLQREQVTVDAVYGDDAPRPLRGISVRESASRRLARMKSLLSGRRQLEPDEALSLLADHGGEGEGDPNTLCMHGPYWETTATVQMLPAERTLRVSLGHRCRAGELVELSL